MIEILNKFPILKNKTNLILILVFVALLSSGYFLLHRFTSRKVDAPLEEVSLSFDPDGPYAILHPRKDGNALILNIKRVSSNDGISYELSYQSDGIDRGLQSKLNTEDKKSEYTQEILFGTCSKGDTFSTLHCVFDKNVENGTLILKIKKRNKLYLMSTQWHLQRPDITSGLVTSGDAHFNYKTDAKAEDLKLVGFSIVNDLTGAPKLPEGKKVLGKVYSFNVPPTKAFPKGNFYIELGENPPQNAKIAQFIEKENKWKILETKIEGNKLSSSTEINGIFAVLVD